jgi:hypothetical protein
VRPHGGCISLRCQRSEYESLKGSFESLPLAKATFAYAKTHIVVRRSGALQGAANYTGNWQLSEETRVQAPVGLLWFDDALGHFKRSPQPKFIDGIMVSYPKNWNYPRGTGNEGDYPLLDPVLSDMFTGRILTTNEAIALRKTLPKPDPQKREPSQYRPPTQTDPWKPEPPQPGDRLNPLTLKREPRTFLKSYGCDGGFDYGPLYTMRSGTAAFYDKTNESGTIHISGPRSGCTNSIVPACGLLNVPYFYEGCTCSYPLPTGLALVSLPETFEQWTAWGESQPKDIQRIGINFGAPGDRIVRGGTLWLDYPSVGGPSPVISADMKPQQTQFYYRHSVWVPNGDGWPWVNASGAAGLETFILSNLKPGQYTVRLSFAERTAAAVGERVQTVSLQGETVLKDFDIAQATNGAIAGVVREFRDISLDGRLTVELSAKRGRTLISGLELISTSD